MNRIRWTLLFLALGIALPAGLIVQRAIASLELESAVRNEAVANRIFDEMERSLSDFLIREESRPPTDYAPVSLDQEPAAEPPENAELRRSAFANSDEPFIVGLFSLDSSGHTRSLSVRPDDARRVADAVRDALGPRTRADDRELFKEASMPAPGRTRPFKKDRLAQPEAAAADEEAVVESSAYDVFQSLNRAQRVRSERQDKALRKSSGRTLGKSEAVFSPESPSAMRVLERIDTADAIEGTDATAAKTTRPDEDALVLEIEVRGIDPLIGRSTPNGDLVLTRSVWQGSNVERQGLVLDRAALVVWLETRVLAESGLSNRAQILFGAAALLDEEAEIPRRYLHRFAEPFDALIARLDLDPLPGVGSERTIYALALLLALVATRPVKANGSLMESNSDGTSGSRR